ncbi:5-methylcytosine rRNA methyltransferase NSUN4 [Glossina fuscipes]|uniref:NOL1/NOP2/Sun domain family member 4 n=1 Tax=Glossina fuscipes TaxID=7396 RepID=A0A8U0WAI9_9MUSC|nr:5-methylcytosine rRNA methyltransferase NSUN4 [Glossina fuscipes]
MKEDAKHAVFCCIRFDRGRPQSEPDNIINNMISDREVWSAVEVFVTKVMRKLRRVDRQRVKRRGVLSHYLMDGASILPPLFLDIRPGDRVVDACAASGGKYLLMLQTLYPSQIVCNDLMESRVTRIRKVMKEYLFDYHERWEGRRLLLNQCDARKLDEYGTFDKVLVDVPCTTDRHSLMENDNNIFKPTRIKERLRIPELQAAILANCLRLLKPGGNLIYSTCSLSPIQNDGVVHMAMQKVFNDFGLTFTIKDLSSLIHLFSDIYRFERPKGLKYGQMVIPYLPANFGPMYFSKITRDE